MSSHRRVESQVTTPDGRTLRVEESGDPRGKPVLMHHGSPGAGYAYGPQPGRSVADCAADVRAIASALGIERLGIWGISGGGPHALACAALLPDLAVAVASLAALAPYDAPGLDYFTGMGQENVDDIKLSLTDEAASRRKGLADRAGMLALTPEQLDSAFPTLLSEVDRAVRGRELTSWFVWCNHLGLAFGDQGWWDDAMATLRPWGFSLDSIRVPVQLWHGRHDQVVPFQHGEWLASQIPGVDAHLTDVDGHVTLIQNRVPEIHAWLVEHF